jgi:hypothetical protein
MIKPRVPLNPPAAKTEAGMRRFFNVQNVDRYRRLASEVTTATERQQILESLAKEMSVFRSEGKRAVATCST